MTNFDFLRRLFDLQKGFSVDKIIELGFATIAFNATDNSVLSNFALINELITKEQLEKIANELQNLNRTPAVCFENREDLMPLKNFVERESYKKKYEDCWMFYQSDKPSFHTSEKLVKEVKTEKELETFLETFDACYQKDDPQNPYGDVKNFLKSTKNSWMKFRDSDRLQYFMAFKNDHPVAVSALNNYQSFGYISCVGSLKKVRGEGFGKTATLYAVTKSIENGNKETFLATEERTYPNEFYKRLGFVTKFTDVIFAKNSSVVTKG